ncbi:hypothetical protein C8F01DRAFT_1375153 [Mycena amicta]|nr:hypothetical protein C8F01DRAFT_1375153 [Mycena amicta]
MPLHTPNPSYLQGSAVAALTWVVFDVFLTIDSEVESVWRSAWSISTGLYIFTRYHTLLVLGFFAMEVVGNTRFRITDHVLPQLGASTLPASFFAPCIANLTSSHISRWYIGLSEIISILCGELLILIRVNAVYGWSRRVVVLTIILFCAEAVIGLVTTIISLTGGSKLLFDSTKILDCTANQRNVPDINLAIPAAWCTSMAVAFIYLGLIVHRASDITTVVEDANGHTHIRKVGILETLKASKVAPVLVVCLRDAAVYFVVMLAAMTLNIVLILTQHRYAQMGTAWMFATYSVATTRIFLNLKDMASPLSSRNSMTLTELTSALEFRTIQSTVRVPPREIQGVK